MVTLLPYPPTEAVYISNGAIKVLNPFFDQIILLVNDMVAKSFITLKQSCKDMVEIVQCEWI